jgi:hypothetical protein
MPGNHKVFAGGLNQRMATVFGEEILFNFAYVAIIVHMPKVSTRGKEDELEHGRGEASQHE